MRCAIGLSVLAAAFFAAGCGSDNGGGPDLVQDTQAPSSPQNLRVEKIGDGEVWLNWEPVGEKELAYVVYRAEGGLTARALDSIFSTAFKDRDLRYEVEYTYFITALDSAGNESVPSNSVSGQPFNTLSPLAPTGLRATAHHTFILDQLDIVLDWDGNVEADMDHYRVYRSTEEVFATDTASRRTEVTQPRFVDEEVEVGTVYYYRVAAVDKGGKESAPSRKVSDAALALPELMEPIQGELTSSMPSFTWKAVPEARTYRVVVTSSPTSGEVSDMPLTSDTTDVFVGRTKDTVLETGQVYYWKVIASTKEDGLENAVSRVESFKIR